MREKSGAVAEVAVVVVAVAEVVEVAVAQIQTKVQREPISSTLCRTLQSAGGQRSLARVLLGQGAPTSTGPGNSDMLSTSNQSWL